MMRAYLIFISAISLCAMVAPCWATSLDSNVASCVVGANLYFEGSCSTSETASQGGNTALDWVAISGEADNHDPEYVAEQAGFTESGNPTGSLAVATTIPISWDFFVTGGGGCETQSFCDDVSATLTININTTGGDAYFNETWDLGPSVSDYQISGSTTLTIPAGAFTPTDAGYVWDVQIGVTGDFTAVDQPWIEVNVPTGSTIDLNPVLAATTPEPGTIALLCAGVLTLFLRRCL